MSTVFGAIHKKFKGFAVFKGFAAILPHDRRFKHAQNINMEVKSS